MTSRAQEISAKLRELHEQVRCNEQDTEDAEQGRYEASIEFQLYHRHKDMERALLHADDLTRLEAEYGVLWAHIDALYTELNDSSFTSQE